MRRLLSLRGMLYILSGLLLVLIGLYLSFTIADRAVLLRAPSTIEHGGRQRHYRLWTSSERPDRAILVFHGLGSSSRQQAYFSALHNVSDADTLVVYPESTRSDQPGVRHGWNAGYCCGSGWVNQVDDVEFIRSLMARLRQDYGVQRFFVSGFSNGAMFAQRLAAELPEEIDGLVSVAGSLGANGFTHQPRAAVPALLIHGQNDTTLPFTGGIGATDMDFDWPSFEQTLADWRVVNSCSSDARRTQAAGVTVLDYDGCAAPTQGVIYTNAGHVWPGWRLLNFWQQSPDASRRAVEFINNL